MLQEVDAGRLKVRTFLVLGLFKRMRVEGRLFKGDEIPGGEKGMAFRLSGLLHQIWRK